MNIKIGKNRCLMLNYPVTTCMGNSCLPGCRAGDIFDWVFLCCPVSHEMSWMSSRTIGNIE